LLDELKQRGYEVDPPVSAVSASPPASTPAG